MKILFLGDLVGKIGRRAVKQILPELQTELKPDLIIANGENAAHGCGLTEKTANEILDAGVDVITTGNHIWDKPEAFDLFQNPKYNKIIVRPANFPTGFPGAGDAVADVGAKHILIINLLGRVFSKIADLSNPFKKLDEILEKYEGEKFDAVFVDFHAEATSEKVAMGRYADGRVTAVIGTHSHIPTADERILPGGTAYITDAGMVGAVDSILGQSLDVVSGYLTEGPLRMDVIEEGRCGVNGVLIETEDKASAKGGCAFGAKKIKRIYKEINI
ncbi:MAG: TIGR00282 family metallophosphoesterase [Patescibacteria group bacterium]